MLILLTFYAKCFIIINMPKWVNIKFLRRHFLMKEQVCTAKQLLIEKCKTNRLDISNIDFLVKQFTKNLVVIDGDVDHFQPFEQLESCKERDWLMKNFHGRLPKVPAGCQLQVRWMPLYSIEHDSAFFTSTASMCYEDDLGTCWTPTLVAYTQVYPKIWDIPSNSWVNFKVSEKFSSKDGKFAYTHAAFVRLLKTWLPW